MDERDVTALIPVGGHVREDTLLITASGALGKLSIPRWANQGGGPSREQRFGAIVHAEASLHGWIVPAHTTAG